MNKSIVFHGFWWGYIPLTIWGTGSALTPYERTKVEEEFTAYDDEINHEEHWEPLNNETVVCIFSHKVSQTLYTCILDFNKHW